MLALLLTLESVRQWKRHVTVISLVWLAIEDSAMVRRSYKQGCCHRHYRGNPPAAPNFGGNVHYMGGIQINQSGTKKTDLHCSQAVA